MPYEQEKHKIKSNYDKAEELKNNLSKVDYQAEELILDNSIKKIYYFQSGWVIIN